MIYKSALGQTGLKMNSKMASIEPPDGSLRAAEVLFNSISLRDFSWLERKIIIQIRKEWWVPRWCVNVVVKRLFKMLEEIEAYEVRESALLHVSMDDLIKTMLKYLKPMASKSMVAEIDARMVFYDL